MVRVLSLGIVAGGIALTIFGVDASHSFGSEVSRVFTGNPSDRSMTMIIGGVAMIVAGAAGLIVGSLKKR